jgi:predicted nucleic acid-binding protein
VAETWLAADRRVSSLVLYPEARAAVGRAQRLGRIPTSRFAIARHRVEALWASLDRVDLTAELAHRAGDLADEYGLRGYDAVHLASLAGVGDAETVLVSADVELLDAAQAMGFATIRPFV